MGPLATTAQIVAIVVSTGLAFVGLPRAHAAVVGEVIGPGLTNYPIAIPPLRDLTHREPGAAQRFADVLSSDLSLSGYFRVLDPEAYIDDPQSSATQASEIEFLNWSTIGARTLVKGTLDRTPEGFLIEVNLFDVPGQRLLTAKRYRTPAEDLPRAAHRFADEVLRVFTGIPGPFDTEIVFVSRIGGGSKELYVMSFDDAAPRRVTNERSLVVAPTWSRDAKRLTYTSYREGGPALFELGLHVDGRIRKLAAPKGLTTGGAWTPDGLRLAVSTELEGNAEIALLRPDGRLAQRLTRSSAIDVSPSWSPDGRELAFCSDRAGTPQIFITTMDGQIRRLTYNGSYNTSPAWSPRGTEIAYTGRVGGRFQVFIIELASGQVRQVTTSSGDNEDARWAPDGRYLVFSSTRTGRAHLFLMDRTGRIQKQLTHGHRSDTSPAWSLRRVD